MEAVDPLVELRKLYWIVMVEQWENPEGKRHVLTGIRMSMGRLAYRLDKPMRPDQLSDYITAGRPDQTRSI